MNGFSNNIEFINFDPNAENENMSKDDNMNDFHINKYNNPFLEKLESDFESGGESVCSDGNVSQCSYYSEQPLQRQNESFTSFPNMDQSFFSDNLCLTKNLSFNNEKLLNISFDIIQPTKLQKTILNKKIHSPKHSTGGCGNVYKCTHEGCDKAYKSKENLTLHVKNIHLKEKPYSCGFCKAVFSHRNGKTYHERKFHTNFLPHKCEVIGIY
jgi:hypothetical protein